MAYAADLDRISDSARELEDLLRLAQPTRDGAGEEAARRCCAEMRGQDGAIDHMLDEVERLLPVIFGDGRATYPGGIDSLRTRLADQLMAAIGAQLDWLRRRWRDADMQVVSRSLQM